MIDFVKRKEVNFLSESYFLFFWLLAKDFDVFKILTMYEDIFKIKCIKIFIKNLNKTISQSDYNASTSRK